MLQSCETLITKINEWQKAILELEELSDVFLNSGDEKLKSEIEKIRSEIKRLAGEYQILAYPELPNGEKLFWPEKEMLEEIIQKTGLDNERVKIKNNHIVKFVFSTIDLSQFSIDLSLLHNLEWFYASFCQLKKLPYLPTTIKRIWIEGNPDIEIPDDLTNLNNMEMFGAYSCNLKKLSRLSASVKIILIRENPGITEEEKQRIRKEYPNADIGF